MHTDEQPSPSILLPSSHCSAPLTIKSPQTLIPPLLDELPVDELPDDELPDDELPPDPPVFPLLDPLIPPSPA